MPLISNNIIIGSNLQEVKENNSNLPVEEIKTEKNTEYEPDHHILVVNGKNKKIGKRSQYFLDMFTLDDD